MRRLMLFVIVVVTALAMIAPPAGATVHEITGMFCAGEHGNHFPRGVSGGSNERAGNFVQPLLRTGFITSIAPYDGVNGPGMLVSFDFDHPASKLAPHPTEDVFYFGDGTYVTAFVLAGPYTNCRLLRG